MLTTGNTALRSIGATTSTLLYLPWLALAYAQLGKSDEAWRCISEALTLIAKGGVDQKLYLEFLTSTLFDAPIYKTYGALIAGGNFTPPGFAAPLGQKDIRLVLSAAENLRAEAILLLGTTSFAEVGNRLLDLLLFSESPMVQSAYDFLLAQAARIKDGKLRKETLDALGNRNTCVRHRENLTDAQKTAIVQTLISEKLLNPTDAASIKGGAMAGVACRISAMRSIAPEVFCTSPQASPSEAAPPPASTARTTNCSRTPAFMCGSCSTKLATSMRQKMKPRPPKREIITSAVIRARAVMRLTEARKAASTAAENWAVA